MSWAENEVDGYVDLLVSESDRGCILVGAALLDEELAGLFRAILIPELSREMLKVDRPLGSFSARSQMAYALGLIHKQDFDDLDIVRKIRNDTAHFVARRGDGFATDFSNAATVARCRSFN